MITATVEAIANRDPAAGVQQAYRFSDKGLWREAVRGLIASATNDEKRQALLSEMENNPRGEQTPIAISLRARLGEAEK